MSSKPATHSQEQGATALLADDTLDYLDGQHHAWCHHCHPAWAAQRQGRGPAGRAQWPGRDVVALPGGEVDRALTTPGDERLAQLGSERACATCGGSAPADAAALTEEADRG